jgi:hypothetical protein
MERFASSWEKIRRADHSLRALDADIGAQLRWDPLIKPRVKLDPTVYAEPVEGAYRVYAEVREAPLRWGVLVGEIIHNLRSALDHAFFRLANGPGVNPRHLQFPIFKEEADYNRWRQPSKDRKRADPMTHVPARAVSHIEWFEPFKAHARGEPSATDPLARLNEMSNLDKHRLTRPLVLGFGNGWSGVCTGWSDAEVEKVDENAHWPLDTPIYDGTSLVALRFSPAKPDLKVEVEASIPTAVMLDEQSRLIPTLDRMKEHVVDVVASLEPEIR